MTETSLGPKTFLLLLAAAVASSIVLNRSVYTQNPRPRLLASEYARGSLTGGINEATRVLPVTGGIIETPCGQIDIGETLLIGSGTPTAKSTIDSISLVGCGSGRGDDVAIPSAGATTLKWTGPAGGTVVKVQGPIGNVGIYDMQIDAIGAGIGLDIVHSYQSSFKRLSIIHSSQIAIRTQATDFAFPAMVTGNNNNLFESVIISALAGGVAGQIGQGVANTHSIFDSASNEFINCSFVGGLQLRLADNNTFTHTVMSSPTAALKFTGVAGFPASNTFYQAIVLGPIVAEPFGFVAASPNFMLPLMDGDTPHDLSNVGNYLIGFNYKGKFFGKWSTIPTAVQ